MIPREETEVMNTKKDDGHGNDEDDDLDNSTIMVITKTYNSNDFCNIKLIVQWVGTKGKSWLIFLNHIGSLKDNNYDSISKTRINGVTTK